MASEDKPAEPPRRNSYSELTTDQKFSPDDVYIATMGMTGSGKSSMIATCCPEAAGWVGHELESKTTKVQISTFELNTRRVHLIDTPGFDDTNRSDVDVLKDLAYWLGLSYEKRKIKLTGLIYLHPITHTRMAGTPFKNLRTFKKLVGSGSMTSVALVTTMWSENGGQEENDRESQLLNTPNYWGDMIEQGARWFRHTGDRGSAVKIISHFLGQAPTVLNLQKELVDERKDLDYTAAGQEVNAEMNKQREMLERKMEAMKKEMDEALASKDQKWVDDLAADQEKYQRQIEDTKKAQEQMKLDMEKIFAEKEEEYKKSIQEMDGKLKELEEQRKSRERQYEADREAARLEKEEADRKAAEQEEEIGKARNEAVEAHAEKYAAQIAALLTILQRREENEEARKNEAAEAERLKNLRLLALKKESERLEQEREQLKQRQREHEQAMMVAQYRAQAQSQMVSQSYGNSAMAAGLGFGAIAAANNVCCVM